jgi:hypothetical protein
MCGWGLAVMARLMAASLLVVTMISYGFGSYVVQALVAYVYYSPGSYTNVPCLPSNIKHSNTLIEKFSFLQMHAHEAMSSSAKEWRCRCPHQKQLKL